jgi:hypothetical protein
MIIEVEPSTFRVEKSRADAILTLSHGQSVRGYFDLVTRKLVAPDEAHAKAIDKSGFEALLKRAGLDARPRMQTAAV